MDKHFSPFSSYSTKYEIITDEKSTQDSCFQCFICKECRSDKETVQQGRFIYCWKCFERVFGLKCVACQKLITGLSEMVFVYFNDQTWHKECFHCSGCGISLEGRNFEQESRFSYCMPCNEKRKFHLS